MSAPTPLRARALAAATSASYSPDIDGLRRIEFTSESLALSDGDPVSEWLDVGPDAIRLTSTGTARPLWDTTGLINDCPYFDGVDDVVSAIGLSDIDMSGGLTVFVVCVYDVLGASDGPLALNKTAAAHNAEIYITGSSIVSAGNRDGAVFALLTSSSPFAADVALLQTFRFDKSLSPDEKAIRFNGADAAVVTTSGAGANMEPQTAVNDIQVGVGLGTAKFNGWMSCVAMYYGRAMTDAEVADVEANLNARFGVY